MKPIDSLTPVLSGPIQPSPQTPVGNGQFSELLTQMVAQVEQSQLQADQSVAELNGGQAKNLHEVMIAMEEADISMRLMVQVRNKVVEAYQEIMRMQI
jgi:flagellar hook-basal body complex protein FliE